MKKTRVLVPLLTGLLLGMVAIAVQLTFPPVMPGVGIDTARAAPQACARCHIGALPRSSCTTCHGSPPSQLFIQPGNVPVLFPHHTQQPGSAVPNNCTLQTCHGGNVDDVRYTRRPERSMRFCALCHDLTHLSPPPVGSPTAPPLGGPPRAKHETADRPFCLLCHENGLGGAPRPPASHTGRTNDQCTICHRPPKPTPTPTPTPTPAPAPEGAPIYAANNCSLCHGANRLGGIGPAITAGALAGRTQAQVAATITNGQGAMPSKPASLTDAQVQILAAWLKATP